MNENDVSRILSELYRIDPSFRQHEAALERIILTLPGIKPDVQIDRAFVVHLRHRLIRAHARQTFSGVSSMIASVFVRRPVLKAFGVALVVIGVVFIIQREDSRNLTIAINPVGAHAFGSLAPILPAEPQGGKNAGPNVGFGGGTDSAPTAPEGLGGGTMPSLVGGYSATKYVYAGEPFTVPETGYTYKNVANDSNGRDLVRAVQGMNFGANFDSFSDLKVRNLEIAEDKDYGYAISLNVPQGAIAINANWERWHVTERQYNSLPLSDMPSNRSLLAIADSFLLDHHISTADYGTPVVDEGWKDMPAVTTLDGKTMQAYAPDAVLVTYPLVIDGTPVYEGWGAPAGMQVIIDTREQRVQSVNNVSTLGYDRSSYPLETDVQVIKKLATMGPGASAKPITAAGAQVTVALGTPELVLMEYYQNAKSHNERMLIPAMRFPIIKRNATSDAPASVLVPLVKDVVDSLVGSAKLTVRLGETESALGVSITPTEVLEDSRCPASVQCIQAGTVRVQTMLAAGMGAAPQIFALNKPVTTETEEITLIDVSPLRKAGEDIPSTDYTFVFDVRKR